MLKRSILAVSMLAAAGCANRGPSLPPPAQVSPAERQVLRDQVRGHAKTHCGVCHQSTLPTAKPGALAIFDLDAPDWTATLKAEHLPGFLRRLNARLGDSDQRTLRAFIASERAVR